ncbi:hypothetical protein BSPWISOXPB_11000 [uncultured Gammaproteobacteria bacterium]|nr:hypothetical protein BSPWISOXPB_11000 [uncultured Gammaproteobacteria bacterium]
MSMTSNNDSMSMTTWATIGTAAAIEAIGGLFVVLVVLFIMLVVLFVMLVVLFTVSD